MNIKNPYIKILMNIVVFFQLLLLIYSEECPKNSPILYNNESCISKNCSEEEFESKECIINNSNIKTQWITNIIIIGELNFRFINFASYSNGDFVVETTPCPGTDRTKRNFYGLTSTGRDFFLNNNEETPFYSIKAQGQDNEGKKYQSVNFIIKLNEENQDKEFILSITKDKGYMELYDFEHDKIYQRQTKSITQMEHQNERQAGLMILGSDNKYYSIYGFIHDNKLNFFKFQFSSINSIENSFDVIRNDGGKEIQNAQGSNTNCFKIESNIIICFYYNNEGKPTILAIDENFNKKGTLSLNHQGSFEDETFIKCIYFIQDIGVFSFYDHDSNSDENYPFIYFKEYFNGNFRNVIIDPYIILNKYIFVTKSLMNDLTKISNDKICFTATDNEHEILYIVVLKIINLGKVKIRYYSFEIYNLLYYKFLKDIKSHSYNGYLMIGSSMCRQKSCSDDHNDEHFSTLMIFSYPNSTDVELEISDYLFNHNNIKIENLEIDLKDYIKIENNIFGYIYSGIQINFIGGFDKILLFSSITEELITDNYNLKENENIIIKFENNEYLT